MHIPPHLLGPQMRHLCLEMLRWFILLLGVNTDMLQVCVKNEISSVSERCDVKPFIS